jgi:ribosome-binding protein aMBF1 (putative translation factor)
MFDKQKYNREYSKIYYLKQKQQKLQFKNFNDENNNIDLDYMELVKKKPLGNLALQRNRLARELKKNEERVAAYREYLAKQNEIPVHIEKKLN